MYRDTLTLDVGEMGEFPAQVLLRETVGMLWPCEGRPSRVYFTRWDAHVLQNADVHLCS